MNAFSRQARRSPRTLLLLGSLLGMGCVPSSDSPVRINEILPSNSNGCADDINERNDWIELYNTSDKAVDLAGYSLTDDTASWDKSRIPKGITIEGRSITLFWADGAPVPDRNHLTFKIKSAGGEQVVLYDQDGRQVDLYRWKETVSSDVSFARVPDGTGDFVSCYPPTCGNSNSCGN